MLTAHAPAKVNLFLHVGPPAANGRHPLDSLVVFAGPEAADRLSVEAADELYLAVEGPTAPAAGALEDNLVLKAARGLRAAHGLSLGARIALEKRLPVAAGIGGGSADAGAALRLLEALWNVEDRAASLRVAATLGGDVPAAYVSRPLVMRGEGERIEPVRWPEPLPAVLVNPGVPCPTGPVFKRYDAEVQRSDFEEGPARDVRSAEDAVRWALETRNDLEAPARAIVPEIAEALDGLRAQPGARLARMSGSGATCFALFDSRTAAEESAAALRHARPGWWVQATAFGPAD